MNPDLTGCDAKPMQQIKVQETVNFGMKASYEVKCLAEALVRKIKGIPVRNDDVKADEPVGLQRQLNVINNNLDQAMSLLTALTSEFED